ncbi:hypothetical protein I4U23_010448 [Adineta vaga]|nr:hypothetical protein I4U23_010448 [Adineta vaga]
MLYECTFCKVSKSFIRPPSNGIGYCLTCKCDRQFVSNTTAVASTHSPVKPGLSFSSPKRTFEGATDLPHRTGIDRRAHSTAGLVRSPSTTTVNSCGYFFLCLEYMLTLGISKKLFNRQQNRCYCKNCYSVTSRDFLTAGNSKYVIPRGWVRFGLYVDEAQAKVENIWDKWIVSYHGTSPKAAKSIIEHHQFLIPGDQTISGDRIGIGDGHIPDKFEVYTSPTIAYSGCDVYSNAVPFRSTSGKVYKAKSVIQCRQQPQTYKIQSETIGADKKNIRLCPVIPNSEIEYFTIVRSSIIPYGLLIRLFE